MDHAPWKMALVGGAIFVTAWLVVDLAVGRGWNWNGVVGGILFAMGWLLVGTIRKRPRG